MRKISIPHGVRSSANSLALLTTLALSGCAGRLSPASGGNQSRIARPAPRDTAEAIWLAVLKAYTAGGAKSEGDVTLTANRLTGVGEQTDRAPVVLMARPRGKAAYRRDWLERVVRDGVVAGVCHARLALGCSDSVTTSFLELSRPELRGDTAAVEVTDEALNPTACRRKTGTSLGGFMSARFNLVHEEAGWRVVERSGGLAGSTACGASPAEEARIARLMREDSRVRSARSPMAGTYRVTVRFATGDSSVLYSRTEPRPMSTIRDRRKADLSRDEDRPIVGYYLATCSAASVDSLAPTFYGRCLQSYYAVSVAPVSEGADSVWHGDVDPIVEVTWLDPRARVRDLAHSLFGSDDDGRGADWYFMPGQWITSGRGHVTFEWTVKHRDELLYAVRAERISGTTLKGHAR